MTLLEFDMTNFRKFLRLSPNWHHLVLEGIEERMKPIENDFVNQYYQHLFYKKSYTNSSIMYFGGKPGIRVDRILVCEVLEVLGLPTPFVAESATPGFQEGLALAGRATTLHHHLQPQP